MLSVNNAQKNRKAVRDRKKVKLEGDSSKENSPAVTEDENKDEEHLRKQMNCYDFRRLYNCRQSNDQDFSSMSCSRMQVC